MKLDVNKASGNGHEPVAKVDLESGELTCPRCAHLKPGDVENLEKENRRLLRIINSMERDREEQRKSHRERKKVLAAIELWAGMTGHKKANVLATDRFDVVIARRAEGYVFGDPVDEAPEEPCPTICLAIEGLAAFPYVTKDGRAPEGKKKDRHDRLGIALANGESLERFARLGWMARHQHGNGHHATA